MDWKDTVMEEEQIQKLYDWDFWHKINSEGIRAALEFQAEISYKAGRDSFLDDAGNATIPLSEAYKRGYEQCARDAKQGKWGEI